MRATIFITALLGATTALASAIPLEERQTNNFDPCTGTLGSAVCCATDVLGVADLDCAPRKSLPKKLAPFWYFERRHQRFAGPICVIHSVTGSINHRWQA